MEFVNATFLGVIQGLTEFIPVSSSGHLVLFRAWVGTETGYALAFDAVLQLATTMAVLVYFFKDICGYVQTGIRWLFREPVAPHDRTLLFALIVGTIPAVVAGLLLEDAMDTLFRNPSLVAYTLLIGALIMYIADRYAKQQTQLTPARGLVVGLFQVLALIPGFSRSGMTIAGGLFTGMDRVAATRFSFLLAFPILLGSGIKKLLDLYQLQLLSVVGPSLILGSLVAFVVGLCAIHFLLSYLKRNTLTLFIWYRVVLAVILFIVL